MSNVRCKMICQSKQEQHYNDGNGFNIELTPVADGEGENAEFYKWTPAGRLSLSVLNARAAAALEVGRAYYVDLTPADPQT